MASEAAALQGLGAQAASAQAPAHVGGQLPLGMVGEDEVARVSKIRGGAELRQHLAELGFVEGAEVKVISRVNGDCIVSVKGARLALNRTMSSHVMVTLEGSTSPQPRRVVQRGSREALALMQVAGTTTPARRKGTDGNS